MTTPICFYSSSWRGGDGWFTHALAQSLASALTPYQRQLLFVGALMEPQDREAKDANLRRIILPSGGAGGAGKLGKVIRTVWRIACATSGLLRARWLTRDYLITFPHWLSATLLQFILLRLMGARITYVVHDPLPHGWRFPKWARGLERWLIVSTYRLAQHNVVLTSAGKQKMHELGIHPQKVSVIPHGVFASGDAAPIHGNRRFLIFGMLRRNKCILESVLAFERLLSQYPDSRLVVAGAPYSAEPEYWAECEAVLRRLGSSVDCEIGFVPESRVDELFKESDAVLAPYLDFNSQSGVAVLAAFSMRPVIGTSAGGIGELFRAGMSGVQIDGEPSEDAIFRSLVQFREQSADYWRERAIEARGSIAKKMAWSSIGQQYALLFKDGGCPTARDGA